MSGICLNEDNSNFFASNQLQDMTAEALANHARTYARGQVDKVIFCPNAQRASYGSNVIQPIWADVQQDAEGRMTFRETVLQPHIENWVRNARALYEAGVDPYRVWLETTKQENREAWLSCRMNDLHEADNPDSVMHDQFWRDNPDFRRAPYENSALGQALDFSFDQVRDYKLNLIREMLQNYDLDGLEIDWLRFPAYLRPGYEVEDAPVITDFMQQVRNAVADAQETWHHAVKLAVRLPGRPEMARRMGLDVIAWAEAKLLDEVTVSNFWPTTDSDMPMEIWRGLLGPSILLNAGLEINIQAYPGAPAPVQSVDMLYGFASQYLYRGADRIYLFNHMHGMTGLHSPEALEEALDNAGDEETANPMPRRHVVTYAMSGAPGQPAVHVLPLTPGPDWQAIRLNVGGGTDSRYATLNLGFDGQDVPELNVWLNGTLCALEESPLELPCPENVTLQRQFAIPYRTLHDGDNVIQLNAEQGGTSQLVWCEIYLP